MANEKWLTAEQLRSLFCYDDVSSINKLVTTHVLPFKRMKAEDGSGKMVRMFDLIPTVQAYVKYQRDLVLGKKGSDDDAAKLLEADLRYKEARAERAELEVAELRGQMHRAEDVELVVSDMIARLRGGIMAIPGQVAFDCAEAQTSGEAAAIVKEAVENFLNETAHIKYDENDYRNLVREREKWMSGHEGVDEEWEAETPLDEHLNSLNDSETDSGLPRG